MKYHQKSQGLLSLLITLVISVNACTNLLVTPGASEKGDSMIAYNADSGNLMGMLYHYPASGMVSASTRQIWNWDTGVYLGEIPEAEMTFNVVGKSHFQLCNLYMLNSSFLLQFSYIQYFHLFTECFRKYQ